MQYKYSLVLFSSMDSLTSHRFVYASQYSPDFGARNVLQKLKNNKCLCDWGLAFFGNCLFSSNTAFFSSAHFRTEPWIL